MARNPTLSQKSRIALLSGMAFFVVAQAVGLLVIDFDPEYGDRLALLRAQIRDRPRQPIVVVLGSSRVAMGVRPEVIPSPADVQAPVVFNYGLVGSGPVMQLCCVQRLLTDGIRPDWVLIEYWPAFWQQEGELPEKARIELTRLRRSDLPIVKRFFRVPQLKRGWYEGRLVPSFTGRFVFLSRYAPAWVPNGSRLDSTWASLNAYGWLPCIHAHTDEAGYRHRLEHYRVIYEPVLRAFSVSPDSDRALRELLSLCRSHGTGVALLCMPESTDFRGWYPATMSAEVDKYLEFVKKECGIPVIDARTWVPDSGFSDGFHLYPEAAAAFSERLGQEAILPLLGVKPRPEGAR